MANWHPSIKADCEGPLGFPMIDKAAKALDAQLKALPEEDRAYHKSVTSIPTSELVPDERCDVSWISTERPDHVKDIVISRGIDDSIFSMNPIVTLNHKFEHPAVGLSRWWKPYQDGNIKGIRAKTHYPARPRDYSELEAWTPEKIWQLVQLKLLPGKSIGFLPKPGKVRYATQEEIRRNKDWEGAKIYEEWILVEYAVCTKPVNPETLMVEIRKSMDQLDDGLLEILEVSKDILIAGATSPAEATQVEKGLDGQLAAQGVAQVKPEALAGKPVVSEDEVKAFQDLPEKVIPKAWFVTADEYVKSLRNSILHYNYDAFMKDFFKKMLDKHKGRI